MYKNVVCTLFHIGVEESNLNRLVHRWSNREDRMSHWRAVTSKQTNSIGSNGKPQRTSSTKPKSHQGMFGLISGINLGTPFRTRMVRGWAPGVTLLNLTGRTWQKTSEPKRLSTAPKSWCGVYIAPKSTTLSDGTYFQPEEEKLLTGDHRFFCRFTQNSSAWMCISVCGSGKAARSLELTTRTQSSR